MLNEGRMEARGNALAVDARVHLLLEVCAALALTLLLSLLYASTGVSPAGEEELRVPADSLDRTSWFMAARTASCAPLKRPAESPIRSMLELRGTVDGPSRRLDGPDESRPSFPEAMLSILVASLARSSCG